MKTHNCYLHIPQPNIDSGFLVVPLLWLQFKAYHDQYSDTATAWNWIPPETSPSPISDTIAKLSEYDTLDVVGCSNYIWNNSGETEQLCEWVRANHPNCIIVFGGPQQDVKYNHEFFRLNKNVDVCCDQDGYGELFWTPLLDQIASGTVDYSTIPYAIYPDKFRWKQKSGVTPNKREFRWAIDVFGHSSSYMEEFKQTAQVADLQIKASVEFSRGCPYTCTFCDWGGGTGTKVIFKSDESAKQDIRRLFDLGVGVINLMDANLGIVARDVELIQYIVELTKEYQYTPQVTLLGLAKADKRYVNQILDICADTHLADEHFVSAQSFNEPTLKAIRRVDAPWRQQMIDIEPIRARHPKFLVRLQVIIGLPESDLDEFYTWFDEVHHYRSSLIAAPWLLLPTTPANDPAHIEKYSLVKVNFSAYTQSSSRRMPADEFDARSVVTYPIVVGTNKYGFDEWVEMLIVSQFVIAGTLVGWLPSVVDRLASRTNKLPSEIYRNLVQCVLKSVDSPLHRWYDNLQQQIVGSCNNVPGMHLEAHALPTSDGFLYCGEAYWVELMCSDTTWRPTIIQWANNYGQ